MNAEIAGKIEDEEEATYLMERLYLFSQKKTLWDGGLIDNMRRRIRNTMQRRKKNEKISSDGSIRDVSIFVDWMWKE